MSRQANRGKGLEDLVERSNLQYRKQGKALIQKIPTNWTVIRRGKKIVSAFPRSKSTLDFAGVIKGGQSISFDCKETTDEKGLPLANIPKHQIGYMRDALILGEISFLVVHLKHFKKYYVVPGERVIEIWDTWKANKGRRGFNTILEEDMQQVKGSPRIPLDYLGGLKC